MRSALAALNRSHSETRKCYHYGEVGHLSRAYLKPHREKEVGRRGQPSSHGRSHGGQQGGRCGSFGGYKANLIVAEEEKTHSTYSVEEQKILEIWSRMKLASDDSKKATGNRHTFFIQG